jgi:hypothetical protein
MMAKVRRRVASRAISPEVGVGARFSITNAVRQWFNLPRSLDFSDTLGGMCRKVNCRKCGKPSWSGCGAHVEQVLGDVPKSQRCQCSAQAKVATGGTGSFISKVLKKIGGTK